ncbi:MULTISPECIES: hypothetical protein [unclassified Xanthobacter]|uniref:hypothetical protein n=1 Tax=unclassified Xanthobacter TaxID=2623496 RepID=UPI001F288D56|nr:MULTISPECIES: hypothetical protein [unclassified Xanthobacter]
MGLSEDILAPLRDAVTDGRLLVLPAFRDIQLYQQVTRVLRDAGGRWDSEARGHRFDCNAEDVLEQILASGEVAARRNMRDQS